MKHPDAHCDCAAAATALALRWRCSVCGKTAIMKVSTPAAACDGESVRKVEPQDVRQAPARASRFLPLGVAPRSHPYQQSPCSAEFKP